MLDKSYSLSAIISFSGLNYVFHFVYPPLFLSDFILMKIFYLFILITRTDFSRVIHITAYWQKMLFHSYPFFITIAGEHESSLQVLSLIHI